MMRTKQILAIAFLSILTSIAWTQSKPNFVIIFADDMGYGDAGCYGHPTIKTPNLDRMASEGMRMTQFYVASPVCSASRAALLTGRLPIRNGITGVLFPRNETGLPKSENTIATLLKKEDYATACIGKWHLGHKNGYLPTGHGFDYYYGVPYSNDMYIDSVAPLAKNVILREGVTEEKIRANEYFKHNPKYVPLMRQEEVIEFPADQATLTKRYTEEAIKFIKKHKKDPFFLYLPHTMPHTPLYASEDFEGTSLRGLYGDVIEELDWSVGQVLETLRETGLDKNTLVVFTSDNGPWLIQKLNGGSSGLLKGAKFTTWEGGMREPGIFWWPGKVKAGVVNREMASTLDLLPTILDLAGGSVPDDRVMDGYSLKDMFIKSAISPRNEMFFYKGKNLQAIRLGPWKLHFTTTNEFGKEAIEHEKPLLFNIDEDPSERIDVASQHPDIIAEILKLKSEHEKSVSN
jgi:arylsulfatase A